MSNSESQGNFELTIRVPKRPKLKFGLLFLFILTLIIAVVLGAFQIGRDFGFSQGYSEGYNSGWSDLMQAKLVIKAYKVADLVISTDQSTEPDSAFANFDALIQDLCQSVDAASWESQGGPATVAQYSQNLSLVVSQTPRAHSQIEIFLHEKREKLKKANE